jgi:hypothetical protein
VADRGISSHSERNLNSARRDASQLGAHDEF